MPERDQELIRSLRRAYEAFSSGDFDSAVEMAHPEIEFIPPGGGISGKAALRAWTEPDALEDQRIQPLDFSVNGNRVLVRQNTRARGAMSGIELDLDTWAVWTFDDDGLATRLETFPIHEEGLALAAAGLGAGDA